MALSRVTSQTRPITNSKYLTLGKAAPMRSLEIPGRREAEPNRHFIEQKLGQALTRRRHAFRIEKPMQMHNKVAHFGVVDGSLRLCPPGRISAGVIGIDTDEIKLFEILELYAGHVAEFAAEYKVKELVRLLRAFGMIPFHGLRSTSTWLGRLEYHPKV